MPKPICDPKQNITRFKKELNLRAENSFMKILRNNSSSGVRGQERRRRRGKKKGDGDG